MVNEDKKSRKSKSTWFSFGGVIIVLGAIGAYIVWPQLSLNKPTDVIIVKAVDGPIKVKPLDPGGTIVKHQDLFVIELLRNGVASSGEVETLRPDFPVPEPPPIDGGKSANSTIDRKALTIAAGDDASDTEVAAETEKKQEKPQTRAEKLPFKETNEPAFMIQLAAFRSAKKAEEIASLLSAKHSARLKSIRLQTMRLDTGSNGIFFRVVSPPLARSQAEVVCVNLRQAGQDCFLRKITASEG